MNEILEALQGVVLTEPDPEVQPNPAQPDDVAIETQLTQEISVLWSDHLRLSANHKTTAKELRLLRTRLADRLYAIKSHLCRPELGRASQWRGWLRQQGIPRSTADRLVARHGEMLGGHDETVLNEAPSEQAESAAEKLAKSVWQRVGKLLTTGDSVIQFIDCIAELSGVRHEQRAEGLMIFIPVPTVAGEVPGTASTGNPVQHPSGEALAATEEPRNETAVTPIEEGLPVTREEASAGVAA